MKLRPNKNNALTIYHIFLLVFFGSAVSSLEANQTDSSCQCPSDNETALTSLEQNAVDMQEAVKNKTNLFSKIHHRAFHNNDAKSASMVVSAMLIFIVVGVLMTKMWKDRTYVTMQGTNQPVRYEHYNAKDEILVKDLVAGKTTRGYKLTKEDMLKSRARSFIGLFTRRGRKKSYRPVSLKMETFLTGTATDEVDAESHERLLASSSSDESNGFDEYFDTTESEDDFVFAINRRTGEWMGENSTKSESKSLLGIESGRTKKKKKSSETLEELRRLSSSSDSDSDGFRFG